MSSDPLGPQQRICVFCWPYRDPVTGDPLRDENGAVTRDCALCVGRDSDRWCEHDCQWLNEGADS